MRAITFHGVREEVNCRTWARPPCSQSDEKWPAVRVNRPWDAALEVYTDEPDVSWQGRSSAAKQIDVLNYTSDP